MITNAHSIAGGRQMPFVQAAVVPGIAYWVTITEACQHMSCTCKLPLHGMSNLVR